MGAVDIIADVAGLVIPGVPSAGVKAGVKAVDTAHDAYKAVDTLHDASKVADATKTIVKNGDNILDAADAAKDLKKASNIADAGKDSSKALTQCKSLSDNLPHYENVLKDGPAVGVGKDFTAAQKKKIISENMRRNGGIVKSDDFNDYYSVLKKPQKSRKGVTPDPDEWQIDHIIPKDKGGSNSYSNARVISRRLNREKWNK